MSEAREDVLVAMSGGVDSAVAAAMLVRLGYNVTGAFLCLGSRGDTSTDGRGCCSPQDATDARRVALKLGIPLLVIDCAADFEAIIEYFVGEYRRGRTPNPCVHCNAHIKLGRLLARADALGARYVATGHYARRITTGAQPHLARAIARAKDQSYVLFGLAREQIERLLLPVGDYATKAAVRDTARSLGLSVHDKADSQEICFVPEGDYTQLVRARCPEALRSGEIVDTSGRRLGRHDGYARFTIGQRHGLHVATGSPRYVTRIDPDTATVVVGTKQETLGRTLRASRANWHFDIRGEIDATVQIRSNHAGAPARVRVTGVDSFDVEFAQPVSAITPGQAAVVYAGDTLLGGGWIDQAS